MSTHTAPSAPAKGNYVLLGNTGHMAWRVINVGAYGVRIATDRKQRVIKPADVHMLTVIYLNHDDYLNHVRVQGS